jgi:alpha-ketoglutarate-dependent taurine dioxygenase
MLRFSAFPMRDGQRLPLVVSPSRSDIPLSDFSETKRDLIESWLREHGAVLFRGYRVPDIAEFDRFVLTISNDRLDYVHRSTPRTKVGNNIYTATEYPSTQEIPLHNENAYQREWPRKVAFFCRTAAISGGETPLCDMGRVTAIIGKARLDNFELKRVRYVRHYHPYIDVQWNTAFQTDDKDVLSDYCSKHSIEHEWLEHDVLRTTQNCQGIIYHPQTQSRIFFNQAHLFHFSSLGPIVAKQLLEVFGKTRLPRNAFYGNGEEIDLVDLEVVRAAYHDESIQFAWQSGDVLLLDNMQVGHGRRPFVGKREVFAALLDRYQPVQS